jgi:tRNA pseudouridine38-40 synthase
LRDRHRAALRISGTSTMRIALGIEYDGSGFCGWQSQPDGRGIQDAIEQAVGQFLASERRVAVTCAGRTDAGVHALGQVVHLDTDIERDEMSWVRGINRFLPAAVRVLWMRATWGAAPDDFHARFSALSREYTYLLLVDRAKPALLAGRAGWSHRSLDISAMRAAAAPLLGEHDFSSFRSSECQARSPVRRLEMIEVIDAAPFVVFRLRANAFLHHMVRNIVGALVYAGSARLTPEAMRALLVGRDRRVAPPTFAPDGLYLARIAYDAAFGLPDPVPRMPFPLATVLR